MKKLLFATTIAFTFFSKAFTQVYIHHPIDQGVYQRNTTGVADIFISGTYESNPVTSIQARLINPYTSQEISGYGWITIENNPTKGFFQGILYNVPSGFHKLEVRTLQSGVVLDTGSVSKVGIGDVFMAAGQSNAQGYINNNGIGYGSNSQASLTHNYLAYCSTNEIPYPLMEKISETTRIGTNGRDAWCYGRLADNIIGTTGLPVSIFNAGAESSSSENWASSSQNQPTKNIWGHDGNFCEEGTGAGIGILGMPYGHLKKNLKYYTSLFGTRSILWHQGESDNYLGNSASGYTNNVTTVINQSRKDINATIPWVISRASYQDYRTDNNIILGQSNLINNGNQIFAGPQTDLINNSTYPNSRDSRDLHFKVYYGLQLLGDEWSNYLNSSFFSTSIPIMSTLPPTVMANYASGNVTMNVQGSYSEYKWIRIDQDNNHDYGKNSEGSGSSLTRNSGIYRCWVKDSYGRYQVSGAVNVSKIMSYYAQIPTTCSTPVNLTDLPYFSASNGEGPVEINKTPGGRNDGDGKAILINNTSYAKGLGLTAYGNITYKLNAGVFSQFQTTIGIPDDVDGSCSTNAQVVFKVFTDNVEIYSSQAFKKGDPAQIITLNISGKSELRLELQSTSTSGSLLCQKGVFSNPTLLCSSFDTQAPSAPSNLSYSQTGSCNTLNWSASSDNTGVVGYKIYNSNTLLRTISGNTTSATFSGLNIGSTYNYRVTAIDASGNESPASSVNITVPNIDFIYENNFGLCTGPIYYPNNVTPAGGVFSWADNYPSLSLNTSNGGASSGQTQDVNLKYVIAQGTSCEVSKTHTLHFENPYQVPPKVTSNTPIVNTGDTANFTSTACPSPGVLGWSFKDDYPNTNASMPVNGTNFVYSYCKYTYCKIKSNVISINTIPNCNSVWELSSPGSDIPEMGNTLKFNSSSTITASNKLGPNARIEYNAPKVICLTPGFEAKPGTVFKAEIKNCP